MMDPAIFLIKEQRESADRYFLDLTRKRARLLGRRAVGAAIVWWCGAVLALFILTAYLPGLVQNQDKTMSVRGPFGVSKQTATPASGMDGFWQEWAPFREYLGRVVGAIPQNCAITQQGMKLTSSTPGPIARLLVKEPEFPCDWRNSPWSFVHAFWPFDGSVIQKTTLFAMILGLIWLRRQRIERKIDLIAFPKADPGFDPDMSDSSRAEHPVSRLYHSGRTIAEPLYPAKHIILQPRSDGTSSARVYRDGLYSVGALLNASGLRAPIDLIREVVEAGMDQGSVGAATGRKESAVFEFREKAIGRLWPADYLLWLLPTIGFLGTIYGISAALTQAKGLFEEGADFAEKIGPVVDGLGIAFDTTAMALVCAAILYLRLRRSESDVEALAEAADVSLSELLIGRLVDRGTTSGRLAAIPAAGNDDEIGEAVVG